MTDRVLFIGGPDSGKTNYLARLIAHIRDGDGAVEATELPEDLQYIEQALAFLERGQFAPRSHNTTEDISGDVEISIKLSETNETATLSMPDVAGETWDDVVRFAEISQEWLDRIRQASGAILFVRVLSELNVQPIDWVTATELMTMPMGQKQDIEGPTTQVALTQLLRILEQHLGADLKRKAHLAIAVTAFDLLDEERRAAGPMEFLTTEFPIFSGKVRHCDSLDIGVFGISVVGGELSDDNFKSGYLDGDIVESGYVIDQSGNELIQTDDMTRPISWILRHPQP